MSFASLITILCAILILLTGVQVFLLKKEDSRNQVFLLLTILMSWMNICWYEMAHTNDLASAEYYRQLQGVWIFVVPLILYCLWRFAEFHKKSISNTLKITLFSIIIIPASYFFYLELFTTAGHGQLVSLANGSWGLKLNQVDSNNIARALWMAFMYVVGIYFTYVAFQNETTPRLKRMKGILLAVISFSFIASFIQHFIFPSFGAILPVNESVTSLISVLIFGWAFTNFKPIEVGTGAAMENILESMTNLLIVTDKEFRIKNVNPATTLFFGRRPEVLYNQSICALLGKEQSQECMIDLQLNPGRLSKELELDTIDGTAYMHITLSTVYDDAGQVIGYTFIGTDLTDFKKAENQIREYATQLKKSNEALEHFAYIASHDLKEPLRMVNGFVTLLERQMGPILDKQTTEYFTYVTDGVKRMYAIIESILDISRLDYKNGNLERVETLTLIDELKAKFSKDQGITFQYGQLPNVVADRNNLEILFHNIIENGIKYNNKSNRIIRIDCQANGNFNEFSISDNGIGIEPAFHDHIFKMFKRLHTRVQYEGTGMGLAISKRIVEGLGGQIWVESAPGQGTTFKFSLPKFHEHVKKVAKKSPIPLTQAS